MSLKTKISQMPQQPGVYLFKDGEGAVLYVGKAKNLRKRTQSYVRPSAQMEDRKHIMVAKSKDIEFIITDTEEDALLLENTLIKKHKPPFNVIFKDDKSYVYIFIPDEKYPRVLIRRMQGFNPRKGTFFGPYTSSRAVKITLKTLKSIFPYRECSLVSKRACMDYHLGRCAGPCAGKVTEEEYALIIENVKRFLRGDVDHVEKYMNAEMERAAHGEDYELAALWRDRIQALGKVMEKRDVLFKRPVEQDYLSIYKEGDMACINLFRVRGRALTGREFFILEHVQEMTEKQVLSEFETRLYGALAVRPKEVITQGMNVRGQRRRLIELGAENAKENLLRSEAARASKVRRGKEGISHLKEELGLTRLPHRIEGYDISNIQGTDPVGSMVVFTDGLPDNGEYRKFHIRNVKGPNDFAMMQEMLRRRFKHDEWPLPDLLVIDGGKGQLSAVLEIMAEMKVNVPVIGLAKREEEVFQPGKKTSLLLDPPGLYILQALRDEAHRFAITFYRKTHRKRLQKK